ncbi:MAG: hypothetical protein U5R31_03245 [Acidimicrobiia bacterium]|nr:hypothetical protein [Acidimicrobiia bacterium]
MSRDPCRGASAGRPLQQVGPTRGDPEGRGGGRASGEQTRLVAEGASADPDAEDDLLSSARTDTLGGLRRRSEEVRAAAASREKEETTQQRIHDERRFTGGRDPEGAYAARVRGTALAGAELEAILKPFVDEAFDRARREGRCEPWQAYRFDGLLGMARAAAGTDDPDRADRPRGDRDPEGDVGDGGAEVPGWPVGEDRRPPRRRGAAAGAPRRARCVRSRGSVRCRSRWSTTAALDPFWAAVLFDGRDVATVAHLGRQPTAYSAHRPRRPRPRVLCRGLQPHPGLEIDHEIDWAVSRRTKVSDLDLLCGPDRRRRPRAGVSTAGWASAGSFHPDHPDHPGHPGKPTAHASGRRPDP